MPKEPIISFNAGELSPLIDARSDIEKYGSGCRVLENMIPRVYGIAVRRPGTQYIYDADSASAAGRLIPFIYDNDIAYVIEAGDLTFRYFYDGAVVLDGATVVETVTPYVTADLPTLQYVQSVDVMWIVHGSYAPRTLERTDATTFTMTEIPFKYGPFLPRNDYYNDDGTTIQCSKIIAGETAAALVASADTFDDDHVGALWKLILPRVNTNVSGTKAATGTIGAAIDIDGPFTFKTSGNWAATVELQRNEDSNGWETFRTWASTITAGVGSTNAQYSGIEYSQNTQYRIQVTAYTSGTVEANLTVNTSTQSGIVEITAVTNSTNAVATVVSKLASTGATLQWQEGSWSTYRGFPKAVGIYEDRMVYAGTTYEPQTLWFSESGAYDIIR